MMFAAPPSTTAERSSLTQDARRLATVLQQARRLPVKAQEMIAAQPLTIMRDHTIGKVAPPLEQGKPGLHRLAVQRNVRSIKQEPDRSRDLRPCKSIGLAEHPTEFTKRGKRDRHQLRVLRQISREHALCGTIERRRPDEQIGVHNGLHSWPAQPFSITAFISSIVIGLWPSRFSEPKKSERLPAGRSARMRTSPFGNFSNRILSPGRTPRCRSNSPRSVTWPFALTVMAFITLFLSVAKVMDFFLTFKRHWCSVPMIALSTCLTPAHATSARISSQTTAHARAAAAAIHPVTDSAMMNRWLKRVPRTRDFPEDLVATLRSQAPLYVIEMSTAPGCLPCADLWAQLQRLRSAYGWQIRTIAGQDAYLRSGRLGLPWVGHPVAWVRPRGDQQRVIPIAMGTDHAPNLTRNLYLATKMLAGVRPAVAVRAMSKFTGIVGAPTPAHRKR